jgi:hypothetical protein
MNEYSFLRVYGNNTVKKLLINNFLNTINLAMRGALETNDLTTLENLITTTKDFKDVLSKIDTEENKEA